MKLASLITIAITGLSTIVTAQMPADSTTYFLHKFAQNIGKETVYQQMGDSGTIYTVRWKFVDRGRAVPLDARLVVSKNGDPVSLWLKGSTSRFSTIHDSIVFNGTKAVVM